MSTSIYQKKALSTGTAWNKIKIFFPFVWIFFLPWGSFQIQQLHWSSTAPKGETTPDICLNLIQHFQNTMPIFSLSNPASCSLTLSTDTTLFTSPCVPNREKQQVFSNAKRDLKKITTQTFSRRRSPGHHVSFDSKLTAKHRQDQFGFFFYWRFTSSDSFL